ncbi:hypothetical protein RCL1_009059 [Eukaryota sp. TZLM3-RCL]
MSSTSNTKATVITGPQGSSDVPVSSPETAFVGSVPSQQESTSGSVPSQQVPPSSSVPTRQPSPTEHGSEEGDLPPPLLPLPMDPGLREVLDRFAEPFAPPGDQSSPTPSTEKILEDPRIQSVLNGIYDWAIKNRIPTESLFGEQIPSPRHPGTPLLKRDIESVRQNLPLPSQDPLVLRLICRGSAVYSFPRHQATCPNVSDASTALVRNPPPPRVRPLGNSTKVVPDPGDYLPFMKEFSIWSREVNGSTPFVPTLPAGYRNPQLDFDIPRAYLLGVNPRGILQFIHPGLIDIWKSSGYLDPVRWTENDIWLCIVLHSQYPDASSAEQALESTIMDWSIHDPQSRWYDFLNRFQDVLARLTLAGVLYGRPASDVRTSRSFVKQTFLANVGILRLFVDLYPSIHADPNGLITSFIPIVGREHRTWCEGKTYPQQCNNRLIDPIIDPDSGQWQSRPLVQLPQVPPASQETQRPPAPRFDVEKHRRQRVPPMDVCIAFHLITQSDYFVPRNGRKPGPRRGGDKDSTRGAPPNKKNKYDVFLYTKEHRFIPHTPTPGHQTVHSGRVQSNSPPSSDLSPDDVVRYVASSPVPLREGSRRAGRRKDIKDSKLFGWAKFDDKLAHVFGHGTNPDALSRNLGIPDSPHNVSIPDSASTCHHVSIPDSSSTRHHFGIPDSSSTRHHFGIPDSSSTRHHFGIPDSYYDSSGHHLVQGDGYNDVDLHSIDYIDHTILSIDPAQPIKKPQLIKLNILINDVPVTGVIDTAASCSVITKDLASSSHMKILPDSIRYVSANNVTSSSLGTAQGVLSFRLGSIANLVRLNHRLPIIPGSDLLLIGIDILSQLGLLNEDGLSLRLDKEHSVILLSEAEFDDRILMADESSRPAKVIPFASQLTDSGCTITLDDPDKSDSLVALLHQFQEVFSSLPHPDGIDCPPMEIPFHDPTAIVKLPPRRLNPEKQKVAEGIFNDLVSAGFAYFTEDSKFSSPVVLVTYPDHRKPRLTGDFSGSNGVNSHTIPVDPNLPRISDVFEFLSSANYIATLDLPKAFWQLNVATKDQEKTTLSIPGMSIAFKRACFGLKNVPAIFQKHYVVDIRYPRCLHLHR